MYDDIIVLTSAANFLVKSYLYALSFNHLISYDLDNVTKDKLYHNILKNRVISTLKCFRKAQTNYFVN